MANPIYRNPHELRPHEASQMVPEIDEADYEALYQTRVSPSGGLPPDNEGRK